MDGVILQDKPAGRSSHDVVAAVRRRIGGPRKGPGVIRVGHAGTLDPFATGLLIVLVGRATRAQRHVMGLQKRYETTARFGWTSTTGDPEGELTETGRTPAWLDAEVGEEPAGALPSGWIRQRPPAYSAVHVDGRRAYALARAGQAVELPERDVHVARFDRIAPDRFAIDCSAGTYVRSLVADLGDAYCTELRRTAIGPFSIEEASDEVLPLGPALARFLPVLELDADAARRAGHGVAVEGPGDHPTVVLTDADGPIALAEPREGGLLKPVVGFRG